MASAALGVVLLFSCGAPAPTLTPEQRQATTTAIAFATAHPVCDTPDGRQAIERLKQTEVQWRDVLTVAQSTPRLMLAPQVAEMQRLRRDVQAPGPRCTADAQRYLALGIDATVEAFVAYMDQGGQAAIAPAIEQARQHRVAFTNELERIAR